MAQFDHKRLDVYRAAIELVVLIDAIIKLLPRGRSYLADQFQRAGTSVCLNIAEGAGEYAGQEKVRFYRMAKRSATECAAILDICSKLKLVNEEKIERCKELLLCIVSMLIKMARTID